MSTSTIGAADVPRIATDRPSAGLLVLALGAGYAGGRVNVGATDIQPPRDAVRRSRQPPCRPGSPYSGGRRSRWRPPSSPSASRARDRNVNQTSRSRSASSSAGSSATQARAAPCRAGSARAWSSAPTATS